MHQADRTRSRRRRAGSRRNKRLRNVGSFATDSGRLQVRVVRFLRDNLKPAMAMMVSKLERQRIDLIRSGRPIVHFDTPASNHAPTTAVDVAVQASAHTSWWRRRREGRSY